MDIVKFTKETEWNRTDCFNFVTEFVPYFTGLKWDWKRPRWVRKCKGCKHFLSVLDDKIKKKEYKHRADAAMKILGLEDNDDFVRVQIDKHNKPGDVLVVRAMPNGVNTLAVVDTNYTYRCKSETGLIKIDGYPIWCFRKVK